MSILEILLGAFLIWAILIRLRGDHDTRIRVSHPVTASQVVYFKVEKIDGIFYLWNRDTDDFLAQGKTIEEAADVLIERFPNTVFKVANDESQRG